MTAPGNLDKSHETSLCAAGAPDNITGAHRQCKKTSRDGNGGVTTEGGRPAPPSCLYTTLSTPRYGRQPLRRWSSELQRRADCNRAGANGTEGDSVR